jgi:LmbE family N-acetylglucosaminyl deacetylase
MITLDVRRALPKLERVLAIGCHADDIEIGCGGTVLELTRDHAGLHVTWVVLTADEVRAAEARASADAFLAAASSVDVRVLAHRECFLPYDGTAVKESFEDLKAARPDIVFSHAREDFHQDHRLAAELTWNTFRDHLILEYEIPKYDGDVGRPNVFVGLHEETVVEKIRLLEEHFESQADKHWFDSELFRGLMRLRGMECATLYAEAFTCRKLAVTVSG